jgi:hypothetical protein
MYYSKRIQQVFNLDKIRILKLLELAQYTLIFTIITLFISYLLNKFYYKNNNINHKNKYKYKYKNKTNIITIIKLFFKLYLEVLIIVILFFYIRKIGLIIPSLSNYLYPRFKSHTTIDYSIHVAIIVIFIELLPNFKHNLEYFNELLLYY